MIPNDNIPAIEGDIQELAPGPVNPATKKSLVSAAIAASKAPGGGSSGPVDEQRKLNEVTEKNETPVADALMGRPVKVGSFTMRPITLATISLLKEIESPLIMGVPVESVPNIVQNVLELILIQQLSIKEAAQLVRDKDQLRIRCLELGDGIQPGDVQSLVEECTKALQSATSGQVTASEPKLDGAKESTKNAPEGDASSRHG